MTILEVSSHDQSKDADHISRLMDRNRDVLTSLNEEERRAVKLFASPPAENVAEE